MIFMVAFFVIGGIIGYQTTKPCNKECFQERVTEATKEPNLPKESSIERRSK